MFEALPVTSDVYNECKEYEVFRMINIFVLSIFDRLPVQVKHINFNEFCKIVDCSAMGEEIIDVFQTPFDECFGRNSKYFISREINENEELKHQETKDTLLRLLL